MEFYGITLEKAAQIAVMDLSEFTSELNSLEIYIKDSVSYYEKMEISPWDIQIFLKNKEKYHRYTIPLNRFKYMMDSVNFLPTLKEYLINKLNHEN